MYESVSDINGYRLITTKKIKHDFSFIHYVVRNCNERMEFETIKFYHTRLANLFKVHVISFCSSAVFFSDKEAVNFNEISVSACLFLVLKGNKCN